MFFIATSGHLISISSCQHFQKNCLFLIFYVSVLFRVLIHVSDYISVIYFCCVVIFN